MKGKQRFFRRVFIIFAVICMAVFNSYTGDQNIFAEDETTSETVVDNATDISQSEDIYVVAQSDDDEDVSGDTVYSSDLSQFLTGVSITDSTGKTLNPASDQVYVGDTYTFALNFGETNTSGSRLQFEKDSDGYLTYTITNKNLSIKEYTTEQEIKNNNGVVIGYYTITNSGDSAIVKARFLNVDDEGNTTDNVYFENSSTTKFQMNLSAKVVSSDDDNTITVNFNDKINVGITVSSESALSVVKSATYHDYNNIINYSYTVKADKGSIKDVVSVDSPENSKYLIIDESTIKIYELDGETERTDITASVNNGKLTTSSINLNNGEGYIVKYNAYVDVLAYAKDTNQEATIKNTSNLVYNYDATNTVSASGKDNGGKDVTANDSTTTNASYTLMSKSGTTVTEKDENGNTISLIKWTIVLGNRLDYIDAETVTDFISDNMSIYTEKPIFINYYGYQRNDDGTEKSLGSLSYSLDWDDVTIGTTEYNGATYNSFTIPLPENSKKTYIYYYTRYTESGTFVNKAFMDSDKDGTVSSSVSGTVGINVDKSIENVDEDYIYYKVSVDIPAGLKGKRVMFSDSLTAGGQVAKGEAAQDMTFVVTTASGKTYEYTPYSGEGDPEWHYVLSSYWRLNTDGSTSPWSDAGSPWNIDEASTLTITYKVSKDQLLGDGSTVRQKLAEGNTNTVLNSISVITRAGTYSDKVYYSEKDALYKTAKQDGNAIKYDINFTNYKDTSATFHENQKTVYAERVIALPSSFTGAYVQDTFDSRFTLDSDHIISNGTNYGMIAKVYKIGTNLTSSSLGDPIATFACSSDDITISGNTMKANWADFYIMYNGVVMEQEGYDLETIMNAGNSRYCVQFEYYMEPKDALANATISDVTNTATLGWDADGEPITFGPTSTKTTFNQETISKTATQVGDSELLKYAIDVNKGNQDLLENSTKITIDDQMSDNLVFDYSSINVRYKINDTDYFDNYSDLASFYAAYATTYSYDQASDLWNKYEAAKEIEDFTYDAEKNFVSFTVADNIHLEIDYNARIKGEGNDIEVSNTAYINGYAQVKSSTEAKYDVDKTSGAGSSEISYLTVLKQDKDTNDSLNGAVFAVYGPNDTTKNKTPESSDVASTIKVDNETLHYYGQFTVGSGDNKEGSYILNDNDYLADGGTYTLREIKAPTGYETCDDVTFIWNTDLSDTKYPVYTNGSTLVIKDEAKKYTSVPVTKVWNDADDQDGYRPTSITVELYANGEATGKTVTLNESNNWSDEFTNLDAYVKGVKQEYSVKELNDTHYTSKVTGDVSEGFTITNTHKTETTSVSVTKAWDDKDNNDNVRPTSIIVELYANGNATGKTIELDGTKDSNGETSAWVATFDNLDKKSSGQVITYTVKEKDVSNYTITYTDAAGNVLSDATIDGGTITNSYTPKVTEATIKKVWNDDNNNDGKRPSSITVDLMNGETLVQEVTLDSSINWTATIENLPVYTNKVENKYSWKEVNLSDDYTLESTDTNGTITTITNKHDNETTSASVKKVWNDDENNDGKRPSSITVDLMNGETVVQEVILSDSNDWTATVDNLAKYFDGEEIDYTWKETNLSEDYTLESTNTNGTITTITNKHDNETTSASVKKVWNDDNDNDGKRPSSITVDLMNGETVVEEVTLDASNDWSATVNDIAKYSDGKEIEYTWKETNLSEDYTLESTSKEGTVTTLTNKHDNEKTSASVKKVWDDSNDNDGKRPSSITVDLMNGETVVEEVTLDASNDWSATVNDLAKYSDGEEIDYVWQEESLTNGYTLKSTNKEGTLTTITNTRSSDKVNVNGKKIWNDNDDNDGKRPESITVNLIVNGKVIDTTTTDKSKNWEYSFENLPKYDNGEEIEYSVDEPEVEGYETSIDVYVITNTHKPETTSASIKKVWNDDENNDGKRPSSITVDLMNGETVVQEVILSDSNDWTATVNDLPVYTKKVKNTYSWKEVNLSDDYTLESTDTNGTLTTLTNKHDNETTSASVKKVWNDDDNNDGKRPSSITVDLMNGETVVEEVTLDASNDWSTTVDNLAKYFDGEEIEYTWKETNLSEDYTLESTSKEGTVTTLTNKHDNEKTSIDVSKVWSDSDNQDGKRAESVTVHLLADGEDTGNSVVLSDENDWQASFTDLTKYSDGNEIEYTVSEDEVSEYSVEITGDATSGYVITNSYAPKTTSITVHKTWKDENDKDKLRASYGVTLYADGEAVGEEITLGKDVLTYTWDNLPVYKDGNVITYTVEETSVPEGYKVSIVDNLSYEEESWSGSVEITNTHTIKKDINGGGKHKSDEDDTDKKKSNDKDNVDTGDHSNVFYYLGLEALCLAGFVVLRKKK